MGEDTLIAYHSLVPRQIAAVSVYTPTENATGMWRVGFLGGKLSREGVISTVKEW